MSKGSFHPPQERCCGRIWGFLCASPAGGPIRRNMPRGGPPVRNEEYRSDVEFIYLFIFFFEKIHRTFLNTTCLLESSCLVWDFRPSSGYLAIHLSDTKLNRMAQAGTI